MRRPAVSKAGLRALTLPAALPASPQVRVRPAGSDGGAALVAPGQAALFEIAVGAAPGAWRLEVTGMPAEWVTLTPDVVRVDARNAAHAQLLVEVPREAASRPGRIAFDVIALAARGEGGALGRARGALEISPAAAPALSVAEPELRGRRRATTTVTVANTGTLPVQLRLSGGDRNDATEVRFRPAVVDLPAGATTAAQIVVRPNRAMLVGRRRLALTITASDQAGAITPGPPLRFTQRPLLGFGAVVAASLLMLGAVSGAAYLSAHEPITMPQLTGARDVASARAALAAAGIIAAPDVRLRVVRGVTPGTILAQHPLPGAREKASAEVTLEVAVASRRVAVPRLTGIKRRQAAAVITGLRLSPGDAGGAASARVVAQLPLPGTRVPTGTPIEVFTRTASAAGPATVPGVAGEDLAAAMRAVAARGLTPRPVRVVSGARPGTVLGTRPDMGAALTPGSPVVVRVAGGLPRLAFDTAKALHVSDPRVARTVGEARSDSGATEPSWSADGGKLLYRAGHKLVIVPVEAPARGRTILDAPDTYVNATFAPAPRRDVLAMVRRRGGDGDLCFADAGARPMRPRCLADDGWNLGRQISWRADGRALLVFGVRRGDAKRFGILRFTTARPFSMNPARWHGRLVTDASRPRRGVIAAAWAPSGTRVALVSNVATPRFQLVVTGAGTLFKPREQPLPVRACEVAWRPDGDELAVVQSDDACTGSLGDVVRVRLRSPRHGVTVATGARHPSYQPLSYGGQGR